VARFRTGGHHFEVMSRDEIEAVRRRSPAGKSGPWVDHWDEMARKTLVRRLAKYLPLSVQKAAALEEQAELGRYSNVGAHGDVVIEGEIAEETAELQPSTVAALDQFAAEHREPGQD
jgi:recombination protein RecT